MLDVFTEWLRVGRPFVYARFGDGELLCMQGGRGTRYNADGVVYTPELASALEAAYAYFGDHGAFIELLPLATLEIDFRRGWSVLSPLDVLVEYRRWEDYWGYAPWVSCSIVHRANAQLGPMTKFWEQVRVAARPKALVASTRVEGLHHGLRCACWFVAHPTDAYLQVERAAQTIIGACGEKGIAVLSCGPAAKVIQHKVMLVCPQITLIDAGSSFDALYGMPSRGDSLRNTRFADLYGDL